MSEGTVTPNETTIAANTMTGFGGSLTIAASVLDVEIPGKIGFAVDVTLGAIGSGIGQVSDKQWDARDSSSLLGDIATSAAIGFVAGGGPWGAAIRVGVGLMASGVGFVPGGYVYDTFSELPGKNYTKTYSNTVSTTYDEDRSSAARRSDRGFEGAGRASECRPQAGIGRVDRSAREGSRATQPLPLGASRRVIL
jgi:hypothetical protein